MEARRLTGCGLYCAFWPQWLKIYPTRSEWLLESTFSRLITGFGLDFLAGLLSGPSIDRATLQLVGTLFASTLVPGLVGAWVALQQKYAESPAALTLVERKQSKYEGNFCDRRAMP
eukprot:4964278-Amphidinium_carterae.1